MPNKKARRNNNRKEKRPAPPVASTQPPNEMNKAKNLFAKFTDLNVGPKSRRNRMRVIIDGKTREMKWEEAFQLCIMTNPNKDVSELEMICHH